MKMNIIELARKVWCAGDVYIGPSEDQLEHFAKLVRAQALEEAAGIAGEFAQKWWSMHCASNKHMETTRKAHDDFCALQSAIRALKTKDE
jgi:pyruvate carboxylase